MILATRSPIFSNCVLFLFIDSVRIDPGNAFRLVVKVGKFVADREYGLVEMAEQEHEIWFDRIVDYTLSKFHDDMATKIIWGPSQTLSVWAVDNDSDSEWKIRRDEHFEQLIKERPDERVAVVVVDVVSKNEQGSGTAGSVRSASGVTTAEVSGFMPMLEAVELMQIVVHLRMQRAVVTQVVLHPSSAFCA